MKFKAAVLIGLGVISLSLPFGFANSNINKQSEVAEASVGNYSRSQSTYYTSAFSHKVTSSSYGSSLLSTLHELMYDSHQTYNTYEDLWTYTKYTDYDIDNPDNIILIYSRQSINGVQNANVWNREHVWCQSLAFYKTETGAGSDIHHLRPASTAYNSTRSNNPYGVVSTHDSSTRMGDTDCYLYNSVFEPADYIKGDVARILMYMYTHYSSSVSGTSTKSGALTITDIVKTNSSTVQAAWDLLMEWNEFDPVDYQEMIRNNQACVYTGNYNPFIDHPEFARMIWDDSSSQQAGLFFQTSYKTVNVGSNYTNTASAWGNVSSSDSVVYTSDNPSVASVNSSTGQVTGVSNGVARIKARATINGVSKISYHFVKVGSGYTPKHTQNANGIVYTPTSKTTAVASEIIGSETVIYNNTYGVSQITSSNSFTLTINNFPRTIKSIILYMHSNGDKGTGSITVTVGGSTYNSISGKTFAQIYGSYTQSFVPIDVTNSNASVKTGTIVISASCTVNSFYFQKAVIDYTERTITKATSISVLPSSIEMTPGEDNYLTTSFNPSSTTLQACTWSSSNTSVAAVNKYGLVRAISKGNATITATSTDGNGATGSTSISVVDDISGDGDPTVSSVTVSPSELSLDLSGTTSGNLTAVVNGTNNPSQAVTWTVASSSPSGCVTVNSSGVVTANAVGTATVRATSVADNTKYGNCTVTVTNNPTPTVNSVTVSPKSLSLDLAGTKTGNLTATVSVSNGAAQTVSWTSSNTNVATVSSGGVVTAKAVGNATITATSTVDGTKSDTCTVTVTNSSAQTYTYTDTIDNAFTGISGNAYTNWSSKSGADGAVYAGNSAGQYSSVQLRSGTSSGSSQHSGILTTSSGGTAKKVAVTWNSNSGSGRTLDVYGKNTAYSTDANDLYSNSTQGTKIGSIVCGTSTELSITTAYTFIGLRSNNGAMYFDSIVITWEKEGSGQQTTSVTGVSLDKNSASIAVGGTTQLAATVSPAGATDKSVSWTSGDDEIATVSNTGLVTGVGVGETTITVTTTDGGFTASCTVTVEDGSSTSTSTDIIFSEAGYSNGAVIGTVSFYNNTTYSQTITGTFDKGNNSGGNTTKYYDNGTAARMYPGNTLTVTSSKANLTKIEFTFGTSDPTDSNYAITANVGTYSETAGPGNKGTWTATVGTISTVVFTVGGTSGSNRRISEIKLTYYDATAYATDFLSTISCNNGVTPPSTSSWSTMATKYTYLFTEDQNTLKNASADESGTTVEKAVARYEYIIKKYGSATYNDFFTRMGGNYLPVVNKINSKIDITTLIVVIISVGAAISIGGYFFFRRKKEE